MSEWAKQADNHRPERCGVCGGGIKSYRLEHYDDWLQVDHDPVRKRFESWEELSLAQRTFTTTHKVPRRRAPSEAQQDAIAEERGTA